MEPKSKLALITGGAKGLGKMTALALADAGCSIVVNYKSSSSEAKELVQQLERKGVKALAVQADITKPQELQHMASFVEQAMGTVNILVNNAGPFIRERKYFHDYDADEIQYLLQGNLLSAIQLDHIVLPGMRKLGWGRIVHYGFGRAAEARGWPHRSVYAAAKVGLVSFTKSLAVEEAEHGITVNMICPGDIRGANKEKRIEDVKHLSDEESPSTRPGSGEDTARVVRFLCEDRSDFLTGNIIDVSGGFDPIRTLPIK